MALIPLCARVFTKSKTLAHKTNLLEVLLRVYSRVDEPPAPRTPPAGGDLFRYTCAILEQDYNSGRVPPKSVYSLRCVLRAFQSVIFLG